LVEFGLLVLEKIFENFQCIFNLLLLSPLGEGLSPSIKQTSTQRQFVPSLVTLVQWFWRRFLNDPTPYLHFCNYLSFEEDLALYLNKLEFPSPKDNLY
jgi:hypothetical protein